MGVIANRACMSVSGTPGTGPVTLGSAVAGYQSFAAAGIADGALVSYAINDGNPLGSTFEFGQGTYSASGGTLTRTTVQGNSSGTTAAISLTSSAQVEVTPLATDWARSRVRQTVQAGPASAGAPSFLPGTSSSLSLTAQNVTTSAPLIVSAAQGSNGNGEINIIAAVTSNPVWASLVGSQTVAMVSTTTTVATFTTSAAHNLPAGATIIVSGSSQAALNGTWVVATVPSSTTFTLSGPNPQTGTAFTAGAPTGTSYAVTNFLYLNGLSGATSLQTLAPIYQFGGTISTTSGQFTFDHQAMIGYLGNGTTAVATPLVCVGEAVAGASTITSTIAYAYNGTFVGTQATLANGTAYVVNANIGVRDVIVTHWIENTTAENSYAVGDRVYGNEAAYATSASNVYGNYIRTTGRNTQTLLIGATGIGAVNAVGTVTAMTTANWKAGYVIKRAFGGA